MENRQTDVVPRAPDAASSGGGIALVLKILFYFIALPAAVVLGIKWIFHF